MSTSPYNGITWSSREEMYLSKVYSLFSRKVDWGFRLCDLGYYGYADPLLNNDLPNPDLLSFHPTDGDCQHIYIEGCQAIGGSSDSSNDKLYIEERLDEYSDGHSVDRSDVAAYLARKNHDFTPSVQEVVVVLPYHIYDKYTEHISREINEKNIILWVVKQNGNVQIWKEAGSHSSLDLDDKISTELKAYPSSNDLLQYSRSTSRTRLKFEFISRLVRNAGRTRQLTFEFADVDQIMVDNYPPILSHLPKETREEQYWGDFLYGMLNNFDLIEQTESLDSHEYQWTEKNFINEPRYRHRILKRVRDELGVESGGNL